jgi:hypothetical protein
MIAIEGKYQVPNNSSIITIYRLARLAERHEPSGEVREYCEEPDGSRRSAYDFITLSPRHSRGFAGKKWGRFRIVRRYNSNKR